MQTHDLIQGSAQWLEVRAKHFTASEAPAMLGLSKYTTRSELLRQKATGTTEDIGPAKQRLFDAGHESEAKARTIAERLIGEDVFPVTGSREVEGLPLLASFDGLTMCEDVDWENKLWNEEFAQQVAEGIVPDTHWPQLEQQLLISGAAKALFTVSDGTEEKTVHTWYESRPERRAALIAGWKQFAADLAAYQHVEVIPAAVAAPVKDLPAVIYKLNGTALTSNLAEYKVRALELVEDSKKPMESDQDFADRIDLCKKFGEAEKKIELMQAQVVGEIHDVNAFCTDLGEISKMFRQARIAGEKLVEAEKANRKNKILTGAKEKWQEHVAGLNKRLGKNYMPEIPADFALAIKGLKSMSSMQNAVDTLLANAKLAANAACDKIDGNLKTLRELAADHAFLFADTPQLIGKDNDDLTAIIKSRINEHVEAKRKEEEATRERIRAEEQAKAQREAEAKAKAEREAFEKQQAEAAEQQRQKDAAEAKAKADAEADEKAKQQTDQATVSSNGASSTPEFPAVLSPAEAVADPAPSAAPTATGAASVTDRSNLQREIECALSEMTYAELQQVAHFIDRMQSLRKAA